MSTYKVEGMSCGHCISAIERAVAGVDPGARATCDLGAKTVVIEGARDEQAVLQSIRDAGYEPIAS